MSWDFAKAITTFHPTFIYIYIPQMHTFLLFELQNGMEFCSSKYDHDTQQVHCLSHPSSQFPSNDILLREHFKRTIVKQFYSQKKDTILSHPSHCISDYKHIELLQKNPLLFHDKRNPIELRLYRYEIRLDFLLFILS